MKTLIVYESFFGNTEKIAMAICAGMDGKAEVVKAADVKPEQFQGVELLLVGSPTRGFQPAEGTKKFLASIPAGTLKGVKVAAFDTRIALEDIKQGFIRFMAGMFGYAAKPIANQLKNKGGELAAEPEGFYVKESEGPLKDGELERAAAWGKQIGG